MATIQDAIVSMMNARGMNQAELARVSGVSKSSLSRYLGGDEIPASKLLAIAEALNVTVDQLLGIAPYVLSSDERELVDLFRACGPRERALLMDNARAFAALSEKDGAGAGRDVARDRGAVIS